MSQQTMTPPQADHPDVMDWEVDEDLHRARLILADRTYRDTASSASSPSEFDRAGTTSLANPATAAQPIQLRSRSVETPRIVRFDAPKNRRTTDEHAAKDRSVRRFDGEHAAIPAPHPKTTAASDYPASPQGGWRPWVFAATGFIGGNLAMSLGGVSPSYLPTIIIAEAILGIVVCIAFYPHHKSEQADSRITL